MSQRQLVYHRGVSADVFLKVHAPRYTVAQQSLMLALAMSETTLLRLRHPDQPAG